MFDQPIVAETTVNASTAGAVCTMRNRTGAEIVKAHHELHGRLAKSGTHVETTHANLAMILTGDPLLSGVVWHDEFSGRDMLMESMPEFDSALPPARGPYPRPLTDADVIHLLAYVQQKWASGFNKSAVEDCLKVASLANRHHPVRDGLERLEWDGVQRLDTWLVQTFGCDDTAYHRAVGSKLLIAAVRRVRQPGCKFDHLPVLGGPQGIGKSSALRTLFGPEWFTDNIPADLGGKDAALALAGVWAVELAEIEQLIRCEAETVKAFLSRQVDRYRPPYGRRPIEVPRQCVLIGTTNAAEYLRDSTGNRRIWPVACPRQADLEWLEANRRQLWAEAAHAEAQGAKIWLDDPAVAQVAAEAARDKLTDDPWSHRIVEVVAGKASVRVPDILKAIGIDTKDQDKRAQMRVTQILQQSGWTRSHEWDKAQKTTVKLWQAPESNGVIAPHVDAAAFVAGLWPDPEQGSVAPVRP